MNFDFETLTKEVGTLFTHLKLKLVTAESCTGGQVAEVITRIPGSSKWFERGFITYSNAAKIEMLEVKDKTISKHGAVSEETAREMATGALKHSHADISIAVTGIAGPDGGTEAKPVGTVWFAWAGKKGMIHSEYQLFSGNRLTVRNKATFFALEKLTKYIKDFL